MKVLIVGAGIGGLTLSALLRKRGIDTVVIEREKEWKHIGYVLGLFPNGMRVLREVGIADELLSEGKRIPAHYVVDEDAHVISKADFTSLTAEHEAVVEVERENLHGALRRANDDAAVRMGVTVKSLVDNDDGVIVTFSDDSTETYDLVVGADGINSHMRDYVQPKEKDYSGLTFWLTWIPDDPSFPEDIVYYAGEGKGAALFPCKKGDHIGVLFALSAAEKTPIDPACFREHLRKNFAEMHGVMPKVLQSLPELPASMYHNDDNEMHLRKWYRGRIALLGDAVHALSPILGMGASMAMEDAHVLAELLAECETVDAALAEYQRRRAPRLRQLARWSNVIHRMIRMRGPLARVRNFVIKTFFIKHYFKSLQLFLGSPV